MQKTDKYVAPSIAMSLSAIYNPKLKKSAEVVKVVIENALPVLRKLLNFDKSVTIRIAPIKARNTNGRYYDDSKLVEIDCRLPWDKALEVLCHELVHAEQYYEGRLEHVYVAHKGFVHQWNGSIDFNKGSTYKAYRNQPWEQEAWDRQGKLAEQVNQILGA